MNSTLKFNNTTTITNTKHVGQFTQTIHDENYKCKMESELEKLFELHENTNKLSTQSEFEMKTKFDMSRYPNKTIAPLMNLSLTKPTDSVENSIQTNMEFYYNQQRKRFMGPSPLIDPADQPPANKMYFLTAAQELSNQCKKKYGTLNALQPIQIQKPLGLRRPVQSKFVPPVCTEQQPQYNASKYIFIENIQKNSLYNLFLLCLLVLHCQW